MTRLPLSFVSVVSCLLLAAPAATAAVDLPVIAWDPGVPGGIPQVTGPVPNVMDHGAAADGTTNDLAAFEAALAALPDGGVLFVPAGDYPLDGSLEIETDGVVLRGDGADRTRLLLGNAETASLNIITYGRGEWQTLAVAPVRGDRTVTVPDGAAFTVGESAEIQMADDPSLMYTDPEWEVDWAYDARGQLLEVAAIDGNELTFRHPLYLDYPLADAPQIRPQRFVQHVGIEKIYLERLTDGSDVSIVQWKNKVARQSGSRRSRITKSSCPTTGSADRAFWATSHGRSWARTSTPASICPLPIAWRPVASSHPRTNGGAQGAARPLAGTPAPRRVTLRETALQRVRPGRVGAERVRRQADPRVETVPRAPAAASQAAAAGQQPAAQRAAAAAPPGAVPRVARAPCRATATWLMPALPATAKPLTPRLAATTRDAAAAQRGGGPRGPAVRPCSWSWASCCSGEDPAFATACAD